MTIADHCPAGHSKSCPTARVTSSTATRTSVAMCTGTNIGSNPDSVITRPFRHMTRTADSPTTRTSKCFHIERLRLSNLSNFDGGASTKPKHQSLNRRAASYQRPLVDQVRHFDVPIALRSPELSRERPPVTTGLRNIVCRNGVPTDLFFGWSGLVLVHLDDSALPPESVLSCPGFSCRQQLVSPLD